MQTTLRLSPVPRFAWLVVVALLIAALAVFALVTGSHTRTLPAPFGPARNGTVVYGGSDGDIHALDAVTGARSVLVGGAAQDSSPSLSPDGTRFLFLHDVVVNVATGGKDATIMVATVDGTNTRALTNPLANIQATAWSNDGSRVLVSADRAGQPALSLFRVDGSTAPIELDIHGMSAIYLGFRPGDAEITFRGTLGTTEGLFAVGADGRGLRTILADGASDFGILSPDGTKIAYQISNGTTLASIHVLDVATGRELAAAFDPPPGVGVIDDAPTWSPDGSQLLFRRYQGSSAYRLAVVPAAGGHVVEIGPTRTVTATDSQQFSPDGTLVLAFYGSGGSAWILDPTGVAADRQLPAGMVDRPAWQRLAP